MFDAAIRVLNERGPGAMSMSDIADAAGVAPTSLYRRWGTLDALLLEVAIEKLRTDKAIRDTGSLEGDLRAWGRRIVSTFRKPDRSSIFMVLVASVVRMESTPQQRAKAIEPRAAQIREMLERARERGDATPALADVRDYFLAPLYVRAIFGGELNNACVERLLRNLLRLAT